MRRTLHENHAVSVSGRLALVVASQCNAEKTLPFLPSAKGPIDTDAVQSEQQLAQKVHRLLTSAGMGECEPVDVDGQSLSGLLLNPTTREARKALAEAMRRADEAEAVLLIYFLGHGGLHDSGGSPRHALYLWDSRPEAAGQQEPSAVESLWDPYGEIRVLRQEHPRVAGLLLLVDACQASYARDVANSWGSAQGGLDSVFLGSSDSGPAFDGCFTRVLVEQFGRGVSKHEHPSNEFKVLLNAVDLAQIVSRDCKHQKPTPAGYNWTNVALWIAMNPSHAEFAEDLGLDGSTAKLISDRTAHSVEFATEFARTLIAESQLACIVGPAGSGKTSLAASLRSEGAVDAVVFASTCRSEYELADTLRGQLDRLPGFGHSVKAFQEGLRGMTQPLSPFHRLVAGPLANHKPDVRLVVDGLDQMVQDPSFTGVVRALGQLANGPDTSNVRLLLLGREPVTIPGFRVESMPTLTNDVAAQYLELRGISAENAGNLAALAGPSWLVLSLGADLAHRDGNVGAASLDDVYRDLLHPLRVDEGPAADDLLAILATAGPGPVLPFSVLQSVMAARGHTATRSRVLDILGHPSLYRVVDRQRPGLDDERLGLFHLSLVDYLQHGDTFEGARSALLDDCRRWQQDQSGYAVSRLPSLLFETGEHEELDRLMHSADFLACKALTSGVASCAADLSMAALDGVQDAEAIRDALVQYAHLPDRITDPAQLAANLRMRIPLLQHGLWTEPPVLLEPEGGHPLPDTPHHDQLRMLPGRATDLAWTPEGQLLVARDELWLYSPGFLEEPRRVATPHSSVQWSLARSKDGQIAVTSIGSGRALIQAPGGDTWGTVAEHPSLGDITHLRWSRDGQLAVCGTRGYLAVVEFDATTPTVRVLDAFGKENVVSVAWSPNGRLAAVDDRGQALIFAADLASSQKVPLPTGFGARSLAFQGEGALLIAGGSGVLRWTATGTPKMIMDRAVSIIACSTDDPFIAAAEEGLTGRIFILDLADAAGPARQTLWGHTGEIAALDWADDGRLASASVDGVRIWHPQPPGHPPQAQPPVLGMVGGIAWTDHGRAWSGSAGTTIVDPAGTEWSIPRRNCMLAWLPDGRLVLSPTTGGGGIEIWDRNMGLTGSASGRASGSWGLGVSSAGQVLAVNGSKVLWIYQPDNEIVIELANDGSAYAWRGPIQGNKPARMCRKLGAHWAPCGKDWGDTEFPSLFRSQPFQGAVSVSCNGTNLAATGHADGHVIVWDLSALSRLYVRHAGEGRVFSSAWAPDGTTLCAVAGRDLCVWADAEAEPIVRRFPRTLKAVAWSSRGLAVGDEDGTVSVVEHDSTGLRLLATLALDDEVGSITWSPDGSALFVGTAKGSALLRYRAAADR